MFIFILFSDGDSGDVTQEGWLDLTLSPLRVTNILFLLKMPPHFFQFNSVFYFKEKSCHVLSNV